MSEWALQLILAINSFALGALTVLATQAIRRHLGHNKASHPKKEPVATIGLSPEVKQRLLRDAEINFRAVLDKSVSSLSDELDSTTEALRQQITKLGNTVTSEEANQYHRTLTELQQQAKDTLGGVQSVIARHQTELTTKLADRQAATEAELQKKLAGIEAELETRQAQLQTELNERQAELEAELEKEYSELRTGFTKRQATFEAELQKHQAELQSQLTERQSQLTAIQTKLDTELEARRASMEQALEQEMAAKREFLVTQLEAKLSDAVSTFLFEALQHHVDLGAQGPYLTALLNEHKAELVGSIQDDTA